MISIIRPSPAAIDALEKREGYAYRSVAAYDHFRAMGFVATHLGCEPHKDAQGLVYLRAVDVLAVDFEGPPCLFEGPLSETALDALGLVSHRSIVSAEKINTQPLGADYPRPVFYPRILYRRMVETVPNNGCLVQEQYPVQSITAQVLEEVPEGWVVLTTADLDEDHLGQPVLLQRGSIFVSLLAIFDLVGACQTFPPLPGRYAGRDYPSLSSFRFYPVANDARCCGNIMSTACTLFLHTVFAKCAIPLPRVREYPVGYHAAFTVRHDYDRRTSANSIEELLEFYAARNLKCSIGFLASRLDTEAIELFANAGHEILLHTNALTDHEFAHEFRQVRKSSPSPVVGMTIHGGEVGYRGDMQLQFAARHQLSYAESFTMFWVPFMPLYSWDTGGPFPPHNLLGSTRHFSLDIDTGPQDHRFDDLARVIGQELTGHRYLLLMNHPDIHREQLEQLVDLLPLEGVWLTTSGELAGWYNATHYGVNAQWDGSAWRIELGAPLVLSPVVELWTAEGIIGTMGLAPCNAQPHTKAPFGAWSTMMVDEDVCKALSVTRQPSERCCSAADGHGQSIPGKNNASQQRKTPMATVKKSKKSSCNKVVLVSSTIDSLRREMTDHDLHSKISAAVLTDLNSEVVADFPAPIGGVHRLSECFGEARQVCKGATFLLAPSLDKHGLFVKNSLRHALLRAGGTAGTTTSSSPTLVETFGYWLYGQFSYDASGPTDPQILSVKELHYFLFSSSYRATILGAVIQKMAGSPSIERFVDHGTGVGMIPLIVNSIIPLESMACSELKKEYFGIGINLWEQLGLSEKMRMRHVSCEDFTYDGPSQVVFFGQMLFRIPKEKRQRILHDAVDSLKVGGLLVVNEIMDRPELGEVYKADMVSSEDLLGYVRGCGSLYSVSSIVECDSPTLIDSVPQDRFKRSDNMLIMVKK